MSNQLVLGALVRIVGASSCAGKRGTIVAVHAVGSGWCDVSVVASPTKDPVWKFRFSELVIVQDGDE